jgi:hypothetical protein
VMTLAWLTTYAVVIATAGRLLRVSRVQRSIEAVSGVVLVGLGARVADRRALSTARRSPPTSAQPLLAIAAARRFSSSGGTSSLWVATCQ